MRPKNILHLIFVIVLLAGFLHSPGNVQAEKLEANVDKSGDVSAYDLILAMNTLRG